MVNLALMLILITSYKGIVDAKLGCTDTYGTIYNRAWMHYHSPHQMRKIKSETEITLIECQQECNKEVGCRGVGYLHGKWPEGSYHYICELHDVTVQELAAGGGKLGGIDNNIKDRPEISIHDRDCNVCASGYYPNQSKCTPCSRGTYKPEPGNASCYDCVLGAGTSGTGHTYCAELVCKDTYGKFYNRSWMHYKSPHQITKIKNKSEITLVECQEYCNKQVGCRGVGYLHGTWSVGSYHYICELHDVTVQELEEGGEKLGGTDTTIDRPEVSIHDRDCNVCVSGYYSNQSKCTPCSRGTYKPEPGNTSCHDCVVGTGTSGTGHAYCDICVEGFGIKLPSTLSSHITCAECAGKEYSDEKSNKTCERCGKGAQGNGTYGNTECVCKPGFQTSGHACEKCNQHNYKAESGNWSCDSCANISTGSGTSGTGYQYCDICGLGYGLHSYLSSSHIMCVKCQDKMFSNVIGNQPCLECPTNTIGYAEEGDGNTKCAEVSRAKCTNTYPVAHDRKMPAWEYFIDYKRDDSATAKTCQAWCNTVMNCKSVRFKNNQDDSQRWCMIFDISIQDLKDTGRANKITSDSNTDLYPTYITYDRHCECPPGLEPSSYPVVSCKPCSSGFFKASEGNENCTECKGGEVSKNGASCVELPSIKCTYPVKHDWMNPSESYYLGNMTDKKATKETCQAWCDKDVNCKSVVFRIFSYSYRDCYKYNISAQELIDTGRGVVWHPRKTGWITTWITYDKYCGPDKLSTLNGTVTCLPMGYGDKATCHAFSCSFIELEILGAPIRMCVRPID